MELTLFLAKFIGVFSLIYGLSMLLKKKMVMEIFTSFFGERRATVYVLGILEVLGGLAIVLTHNIWNEGLLALVVTIFGWLLLLEGFLYIFLSKQKLMNMWRGFQESASLYYFVAGSMLLLGTYLTYVGFVG